MLRNMFECADAETMKPFKEGTNMQLYAVEWTKNHGDDTKPWNVIVV